MGRHALLLAAAAVVAGVGLVAALRWPHLPAAERGRRRAVAEGCFACHGPEGLDGAANPGRTDRSVPGFGDELMMYAKTRDDIRAWIRDGAPAARARSSSWRQQRQRGALRMPAFKRRLSARTIDDLVAFVEAASGFAAPDDSLPGAGLERAHALGCTGCHGPGGRYARPNPGSFKGYVPSWDGSDFGELVRGREEFDEWVKRGVSRRFESQLAARFFLERAVLRMPAYERHLAPGDLDVLWGYVLWLRQGGPATSPGIEAGVDSVASRR
jgi:mono/diheme cytochrome c family protein